MINRNIGTAERIVRLVLALALLGWVITEGRLGLAQGIALLAAAALLWNSIFGRCYLWKWLRISSCKTQDGNCTAGSGGSQA
jgi:hypothetical protein